MNTNLNLFFRIVFTLLLTKSQLEVSARSSSIRNRRAGGFGYSDPDEWALDNPTCSGSRQSPINIESGEVEQRNVTPPLNWQGYDRMPSKMTLKNNGHSVVVSASWDDDEPPCISGGVLDGGYRFAQFHLHWGSSNDVGSEHTIDGVPYTLELHMVHYKKEYGSFSEALKKDDGLAVVGILYNIDQRTQNSDDRGIAAVQRQGIEIKDPNSEVEITNLFKLSDLNVNFQKYFTYLGSLTTPPCTEIVTWIVSTEFPLVSLRQMDNFRRIQLSHNDDHNYRPTMPVNGRTVSYVAPP